MSQTAEKQKRARTPEADSVASPTDDLRARLDEAAADRASLESELAATPERIRDAAAAGDTDRVLELRRRADDLPTVIFGAKLSEAQARIAYLEASVTEAKSQQPPLDEEWHAAKARLEAAQAAFASADNAAAWARDTVGDYATRLAQARRSYNALLAQPLDPGPVVRSRPHALQANGR